MSYLDGIEKGDQLWDSLANEWLRVVKIDDAGDYPVRFIMGHGCSTMDGCQEISDKNPRYLWDRVEVTLPPKPTRVIRKTGWAVVNTRHLYNTFDQAEEAAGNDSLCKVVFAVMGGMSGFICGPRIYEYKDGENIKEHHMTLLEDNKRQQEYLHAIREALNKVVIEKWIHQKSDPAWDNFVDQTQETISHTLCLIEDKVRTNAK